MRPSIGSHGQRIDEDIIILFRFIVEVIAAHAEIERSAEMRGKPEFLAQLPGMFVRQILGDEPVAATQLRIAENTGQRAIEPDIRIAPYGVRRRSCTGMAVRSPAFVLLMQ